MEAIEEDPVGIRGSDGDEVEIAKPSLKPTGSGDVWLSPLIVLTSLKQTSSRLPSANLPRYKP